jgi:hypothetical protein
MIDLRAVLERHRQLREAQRRSLYETLTRSAAIAAARRGTLVAGDRVFDPISGEEGVVVHGVRENILVSAPGRASD